MEAKILDGINIAIKGYRVCQHIVIYQIEHSDDSDIREYILAKLRFDYDEKSGKIKLQPPFYSIESFEHMKDECREKLGEWLSDFERHYRQYYENDFFKMDLRNNSSQDVAYYNIKISIVAIEEFFDREAFEKDYLARLLHKSYEQYKKSNDCEFTSSRGKLSIEICPLSPKEQDYVVAEMDFDIWHIDSITGVPMVIDDKIIGDTCLGNLSIPRQKHKDFSKAAVRIAIRLKLIDWIKNFAEHYNTYKDYNHRVNLGGHKYSGYDGLYWSECNNRGEVCCSKSQETYDEYTDNYEEKDDFDLERDEYDAGYIED